MQQTAKRLHKSCNVLTTQNSYDGGNHDDVIKWKHFPRYWPFVRGIHRSPVNSPHKGQWRGALMLILICVRINGWVNNREAGDLRRYRAHYDVIEMYASDVAFVTLRSTDMTVGRWTAVFPVDDFCKLVRLMDTGRSQNLLCVPESESCPLKIRAYFDTIR